jgi:hypothetical protein
MTARGLKDEIALVADGLLVDVRLLEGLVGEKGRGGVGEGKDNLEARFVEVVDADVGEILEDVFVSLGDELGEADVVLERGEPELGDALRS